MTELLVGLLTAVPVGAGAMVGLRAGGRRLASRGGAFLLAGALGAIVAAGAHRAAWYAPLGLLTPFALGAATAVLAWYVFARGFAELVGKDRRAGGARTDRVLGAAVGGACGLLVAGTLWIAATLAEGVASAPPREAAPAVVASTWQPPPSGSWAQALIRTANRGFVHHLPVLGPLGDEVEAAVFILNASPAARRQVALERDWARLTRLPSWRALAEDPEVDREMDALRAGNVFALYHLQRNPHVVAFLEEDEVQALLPGLRPSALALEIEACETR